MKARAALAATGVGFGLWGLWLLVDAVEPAALIRLPIWLGGAVVADDFLLVPTTLLYVGLTTLIAIPLLVRQGKGINPTVLPRDYLRDWLLLEATIVVAGAVVFVVQRSRFTFSRSRASSCDIGGR